MIVIGWIIFILGLVLILSMLWKSTTVDGKESDDYAKVAGKCIQIIIIGAIIIWCIDWEVIWWIK